MKLNRSMTIAFTCLLLAAAAFAQGPGTLSGTVTSGGGPLRGVTITVTSSQGASRTVVTDAGGNYNFTDLLPGDYSVRFELQGLQTVTRQVRVGGGETSDLDADLRVGGAGGTGERYTEEVVVTGSLIPRPTIEAMSPVSTLEVEELQAQGVTRLEDFLSNLPQVFAAQNSTISNGASGTATVDLRQLGEERTLVLLDGKRLPTGDRFAIAPDLNFIPAALVKRVDILTGGASTVYGADAVAGVVNFILDTDFEGVRAGISGGQYQHNNRNSVAQRINAVRGFQLAEGSIWDGSQFESFVALGGKFGEDKGHGSVYVDYRNTEQMLKSSRDYTNCSVTARALSGPSCTGSSTIPSGRFITASGLSHTLDTSGQGNTFRPYSGANDLFNFAPFNFMQRPDERWSIGGFLNYEFLANRLSPDGSVRGRSARGYASIMMMDDKSDAQIAPSGTFFVVDKINCNNPMLSADQRQKICTDEGFGPTDIADVLIGKRNVEGGARSNLTTHQAYRVLTGLKGDLNDTWSYDVYGLRGLTKVANQYINDLSVSRMSDALIVDGDPNDPSTWRCRSGNAGCAPYNLFKTGGITQAALDYIQIPLLENTDLLTEVISGTITGDLGRWGLRFPGATEGISIAVGAGYNNFGIVHVPDDNYRIGNAAGQGGPNPTVDGSYHVREAYAEALLPIAQNVPGIRDLSVELGYRSSDYSTTGRFPTYKAQAQYAPNQSFKVRGGYNRATRSPNIVELFRPQGITLGGTIDICAGETPVATLAQCQRTGVTPAQYGRILDNPAGQFNTLSGGNQALTPEIADTVTAGIVFTPVGIPTFSLALDYYNIKLEDRIDVLEADQVIQACADTGDATLCNLIHRDERGTLWLTERAFTQTTFINVAQSRSEGVDINLNYLMPVGPTSLTMNLIGTYLMEQFLDAKLYAYDCVGFMGDQCNQPSPRWQHLSRIGWTRGNAGASLGWRYIGSTKIDAASPDRGLSNPSQVPLYQAVGSFQFNTANYFDVSANYNFGRSTRFTIGVNNLADKEPPLGAGIGEVDFGPGFYGTYDPYGRYVHASLTFNFK